jgi:hypothetical protein
MPKPAHLLNLYPQCLLQRLDLCVLAAQFVRRVFVVAGLCVVCVNQGCQLFCERVRVLIHGLAPSVTI